MKRKNTDLKVSTQHPMKSALTERFLHITYSYFNKHIHIGTLKYKHFLLSTAVSIINKTV